MKKGVLGIIIIAIISCISSSCDKRKSLQELLQEERKAIDRFIAMNDLIILREYPGNGVFNAKEYFRTGDGMFFQVVDSGNGNRVKLFNDVSVRYDYFQYVKNFARGDSTQFVMSTFEPFSFVYGIPQTYTTSYIQCQAWVIPLAYVGEEAVLNMIIPSSLGASTDRNNITPVFFKNLRYTRFN
jgi:hypothetical protein